MQKTCCTVISSEVLEDSSQTPASAAVNDTKRRDSVLAALNWINDPLSSMLKGCNPCDQAGVDKILRYGLDYICLCSKVKYIQNKRHDVENYCAEKEVIDMHDIGFPMFFKMFNCY